MIDNDSAKRVSNKSVKKYMTFFLRSKYSLAGTPSVKKYNSKLAYKKIFVYSKIICRSSKESSGTRTNICAIKQNLGGHWIRTRYLIVWSRRLQGSKSPMAPLSFYSNTVIHYKIPVLTNMRDMLKCFFKNFTGNERG